MTTEENFDRISHAIVCPPGANFIEGISPAIGIPDLERAQGQHQKYCEALEKCGVSLTKLRPDPEFPDGSFIGDTAIVTEYLAIVSNFDETSPRQGEQKEVASALAGGRFMKFISAPGLLDCRDVLQIRDHFYIGLSNYTNGEGAAQLAFFLKEYGFAVTVVPQDAKNPIRLGSAATYLGRDRILIREELARNFAFLEYEKIVVPPEEKGAANALMVNGTLLLPSGYAATLAEARLLGIPVAEINISEFEKMSGSLGRLSVRLPQRAENKVVSLPKRRQTAA